MQSVSTGLARAISYVMSIIYDFANMTFPGTSLKYIHIPMALFAIYFAWRWILGNMFDVEWKK